MPPKKRTPNQPRKSRQKATERTDKYAELARQAREATARSMGDLHLFRPWTFSQTAADRITTIQNRVDSIANDLGTQAIHTRLFRAQVTILGSSSFDQLRQRNDGSYNPDDDRKFKEPLHAAICQSIGDTAIEQLRAKCDGIAFRQDNNEMKVIALLGGVVREETAAVHRAVNSICQSKVFSKPPQPFVTLSAVPLGAYNRNVAAFSLVRSMELEAITLGAMQAPPTYGPIKPLDGIA